MSHKVYNINKSPRHGFVFKEVPTVRGSQYGGSVVAHFEHSYACILDCVYEMADQIATGNGWSVDKAISQVLKDEGWRLLPKHRKNIALRLENNCTENSQFA
jgi:hypothetical protein